MGMVEAPDHEEWLIFRGLSVRMLLIGPALLFALFLPATQPYRWTAIALALGLLFCVGGFLTLQVFGPTSLRTNLWLWVPNNMLANAAVALAIIGSNDPTGAVGFALIAIMLFQAGQPRFVILCFGWLNGTIAFVVASLVVGVPTANVITHTWVFATVSAIAVAVVRFLVNEQQRQRRVASGLATLARETAAAQTVEEGLERCAPTIRALTGATAVRMVPVDEPSAEPSREVRMVAGQDRTGWVALCLDDVRSATLLPSIVDVLSQLCHRDRQLHELEQQARTDPLTGVGNRLELQDLLRTDAVAVALTAVMLDLDHFKHYNDRFGHLAGDQLLRSFAEMVGRELRHPDVVVRWGGEEFCLLVHGSPDHAEVIVDRLRSAWAAHGSGVTFSAGIAAAGADDTNMLDRADAALYEAKAAGRNRTILEA